MTERSARTQRAPVAAAGRATEAVGVADKTLEADFFKGALQKSTRPDVVLVFSYA